MAEGNKTYMGLAVPLRGESEIMQETAATDVLTITATTGASGDFLVCQTAGGGEVFVVDAAGAVSAVGITNTGDITMASGDLAVRAISFGTAGAPTTAPTTGFTKGDMFLVWKSATCPVLAMCVSAVSKAVVYIAAFDANTLGIPST